MLRLCGADLRLVPAVPYANPGNYVRYSETLAKEIAASEPNGAIWANQFDNVANRRGHYRDDRARDLRPDRRQGRRLHLLGRQRRHAGAASPWRSRSATRTCGSPSATPWGRHFITGTPTASSRPKATRLPRASARAESPRTSKASRSTTAYQITDEEALPVLFDLLEHEGLVLGGSTASTWSAPCGSPRSWGPARSSSPSSPMAAQRYQSKLFNPAFLRAKKLPIPPWMK